MFFSWVEFGFGLASVLSFSSLGWSGSFSFELD